MIANYRYFQNSDCEYFPYTVDDPRIKWKTITVL